MQQQQMKNKNHNFRNLLISEQNCINIIWQQIVLTIDDQEYLSQHLLWIGISIGIVFAILSYLPFPFSIPIAIASFFFIIFYIRKKVVKRINSRVRMFGSSNNTNQSLNYYCMTCGTKHNDAACPRCGSKMKRVGS